MSDGITAWRRQIEAQVRERKVALARARARAEQAEQIESILTGERARRDQAGRERIAEGELPTFAAERLNALLERAIERAGEKVGQARRVESSARSVLHDAWKRAAALDRLLGRRRERAQLEARRKEQKEIDEIAGARRSGAAPRPSTIHAGATAPDGRSGAIAPDAESHR